MKSTIRGITCCKVGVSMTNPSAMKAGTTAWSRVNLRDLMTPLRGA